MSHADASALGAGRGPRDAKTLVLPRSYMDLGNLNGEYGVTSLAGAMFKLKSDAQWGAYYEIWGNTITSFTGATFECQRLTETSPYPW